MYRVVNDESFSSNASDIAAEWCNDKGEGWSLIKKLGEGRTSPVFELCSPNGFRALKIYDQEFSHGPLADKERKRIEQQLRFKNHNCSALVKVYDSGTFKNRLFVLMSRAEGKELEKCLHEVPRAKIRSILHDVATACLFLKEHNVCHRDIKAANIFVTEDFSHATLLDIAVVRDIYDPVGVGTDYEDQLPVVATARYSSPEYLFRLIEPGPQLWHALDIYQLGALLHDLIVRVPLFQKEYQESKTNRYRFAWIVATQSPQLDVTDVDEDLVYLARRALDKNWLRRSILSHADFLNTQEQMQKTALRMLGLHGNKIVKFEPNVFEDNVRLDEIAEELVTNLSQYLNSEHDVLTEHSVNSGPAGDNLREVILRWTPNETLESTIVEVALHCMITRLRVANDQRFDVAVELRVEQNGQSKSISVDLPDISDQELVIRPTLLSDQCKAALHSLATRLLATENLVSN